MFIVSVSEEIQDSSSSLLYSPAQALVVGNVMDARHMLMTMF